MILDKVLRKTKGFLWNYKGEPCRGFFNRFAHNSRYFGGGGTFLAQRVDELGLLHWSEDMF
jgi:hypothetical protein